MIYDLDGDVLETWLESMEQAATYGEAVCLLVMTPAEDRNEEDFDDSLRAAYVEAVGLMDRLRFIKAEIETAVGKAMPDDQIPVGQRRPVPHRRPYRQGRCEGTRRYRRGSDLDRRSHHGDSDVLPVVWQQRASYCYEEPGDRSR